MVATLHLQQLTSARVQLDDVVATEHTSIISTLVRLSPLLVRRSVRSAESVHTLHNLRTLNDAAHTAAARIVLGATVGAHVHPLRPDTLHKSPRVFTTENSSDLSHFQKCTIEVLCHVSIF